MLQPHAVVVLPHSIQIDARAQRNCFALAAAGYRVTLVGHGTGMPERGTIAGIDYVLCPPLQSGPGAQAAKLSLTYRAVRKAYHLTAGTRPPQRVVDALNRFDRVGGSLRKRITDVVAGAADPAAEAEQEAPDWRRMLPFIPQMVDAMVPRVVELRPDVLVTDVHLMPLLVEARNRLRNLGHHVGLVYDVREYAYGLASHDPNVTEGFPLLEQEFMADMDGLFTVCQPIAEFLAEQYALPEVPPLVPNAPVAQLPELGRPMTLRDFVDIPDDAPLLAYAGGLSFHRGVHDVVEALPQLPGVHLALGARRPSSYTLELERQAERLGVRDRLHFVPFAPGHEVAEYLASATAAIFPFLPVGNHVFAAPNKYFEAVQARLPVITSNMQWLSEQVTGLGIGEVFEHSNPSSCAHAVRKVLSDLEAYRSRITDEMIHQHSFEACHHVVQEVCTTATAPEKLAGLRPEPLDRQLRGLRRDQLGMRANLADSELFEERPWLRIGDSNVDGQPLEWSIALMARYPRALAEGVYLNEHTGLAPGELTGRRCQRNFMANEAYTAAQTGNRVWQKQVMRKLEDRVTHVLHESGRPMMGDLFGSFHEESEWLREQQITQGLVFHGEDVRDPARHRQLEPDSPYAESHPRTARLQDNAAALMPHIDAFEGPVFVSSPELLDHLPSAEWLPLVVDTQKFAATRQVLLPQVPPMVFFAGSPESPTALAAAALHDARKIRLVIAQDPARYDRQLLGSDIVLDELGIGDWSLSAIEGMSAGKVVIGHVADRVSSRLGVQVPMVQATPATLERVIDDVMADPGAARAVAAGGREFVLEHHDGRRAAELLAGFMGLRP